MIDYIASMSPRTSPHLLYIGDQVGPWTVVGFQSQELPDGSKKETVTVSGPDGQEELSFSDLWQSAN